MKIYFIKCQSGYWAGLQNEIHTYVADKEMAAKFFDKSYAEQVASGWRFENTAGYMKINVSIEPFVIEDYEYIMAPLYR